MAFLKVDNVSKSYDNHRAVNGVSLKVPKGKIYGLLGPNGAGKTSIIRMITGITAPDDGQIFFDGDPLARHHTHETGYMPEERGLYPKMKVKEQIVYLLSLKGLSPKDASHAAKTWLERLGLKDWANRKTTDLSKGMQQKVQFISTVAHKPRLLILDEPFSGLDPVNANLIEQEIYRMKEEGTTIIFSTHRMEQVEELCDHIALMNKGQLILEDDIQEVRKQFQKNVYRVEYKGDRSFWDRFTGAEVAELTDKFAMLKASETVTGKNIMQSLINSPLEILSFQLHLPRLREIFIEAVERS